MLALVRAASAHHQQPAAGGFKQGDAEGLGEGHVEKDVAPVEHLAHVHVLHVPQQLHPFLQAVLLHHGHQQGQLGAVASHDEVDVGEGATDLGSASTTNLF